MKSDYINNESPNSSSNNVVTNVKITPIKTPIVSSNNKEDVKLTMVPALNHSVLIDVGDDPEITEGSDLYSYYVDLRFELACRGGHNLTSVLVNPRETLLEDIFDEFSMDQSTPLEPRFNSSSSAMSSGSQSGHNNNNTTSQHRSSHSQHSSFSSHHASYSIPTSLFSLTKTEQEELTRFLSRMKKLFLQYEKQSSSLSLVESNISSTQTLLQTDSNLRLCYRDVPEQFFSQNFSLSDENCFSLVTSSDSKRLSLHLDQVEVSLLQQISLRSHSFFTTLDDMKSLQQDVSQSVHLLRSLRGSLAQVSSGLEETSLRIPKLQRRVTNCSALHDKLLGMQQVLLARQSVLSLLEAEEFLSAVQVVSEARKLFSQHGLGEIGSMQAVGSQLDDFENLVCEVMCNKFVSLAIQWDDEQDSPSNNNNNNNSGNNSSNNNNNSYEEFKSYSQISRSQQSSDRQSLRDLLRCLLATERTQSALHLYKNRLLEAIRLIIRTCVMEYLSYFDPSILYDHSGSGEESTEDGVGVDNDDNSGNGLSFSQRVREMSAESFLSCLSMCFEHVVVSLTKAEVFHRFVESSLQQQQQDVTTTTTTTEDNTISLISLSKSCLTAACELTQKSVSQLINLRKDCNAKLSLDKIKFLWECSLTFVLSVEQLSGSTAYIVRQCLLSQTKSFLDCLHDSSKGRLVNALDNERWVQCDVSEERQAEIDKLSSGKSFLNPSSSSSSFSSSLMSPTPTIITTTTGTGKRSKDKEMRVVSVDSSEFRCCWSSLLLTETALSYLDVTRNFPPVTSDIINKLVELFRLFDSRTRQLVLGAQAIQSAARLKSISAKHLAIAGQSLGLAVALLPHIRTALLAQIPPKHHLLLTELDRVSHELVEHHGQIVSKFVNIVGDFVDASANKLRSVDWDRFQGTQCEYFEEVQRNVLALHRVLQSILPQEQVQDVFSRIFALLNRKLPSHFEEVMPSTPTGKQRILDEVTHLVTSFSRLKLVDSSSLASGMEETFKKRYLR